MQQRLPRADAERADAERALGYSSSKARHAATPLTAARLSAQPSIVNIRRVDAFMAARGALLLVLIVFSALEHADKYRYRAVLALRAHVLPPPSALCRSVRPPLPPRVRLCRRASAFAAARPLAFAFTLVQIFKPPRGPIFAQLRLKFSG